MILIVEDNANDSYLLTEQMAMANLEKQVRVIEDGQDALDFLLGCPNPPTAVFLDLNLPRLQGVQILRRIRREPRLERLPVVVLTHSISPPDVLTCIEFGAFALLHKPISISTVTTIISRLE